MTEGPYTTLTVEEYNRMGAAIRQLRWKIQKAREMLEAKKFEEALSLLSKTEES